MFRGRHPNVGTATPLLRLQVEVLNRPPRLTVAVVVTQLRHPGAGMIITVLLLQVEGLAPLQRRTVVVVTTLRHLEPDLTNLLCHQAAATTPPAAALQHRHPVAEVVVVTTRTEAATALLSHLAVTATMVSRCQPHQVSNNSSNMNRKLSESVDHVGTPAAVDYNDYSLSSYC